jgi:hypothetical protein
MLHSRLGLVLIPEIKFTAASVDRTGCLAYLLLLDMIKVLISASTQSKPVIVSSQYKQEEKPQHKACRPAPYTTAPVFVFQSGPPQHNSMLCSSVLYTAATAEHNVRNTCSITAQTLQWIQLAHV